VISFIIATNGKPSLAKTLASIECLPGDEILVVGHLDPAMNLYGRRINYVPCAPGGDWGHTERNFGTPYARGQYVAHIDDDDVYAPGMRMLMESAIKETPGRPVLFRMRYPNGITLWREPAIRCGNVGTPMMLIPNRPTMLGTWGSFVGGDCQFLETSKWEAHEYVWRPEVIALLGHNT
jgi:hypothetical protein